MVARVDPTRSHIARAAIGALLHIAERLGELADAQQRTLDVLLKQNAIVQRLLAEAVEGGSDGHPS